MTSNPLLLCVVVALFYNASLINSVNGNCPQGFTIKIFFPSIYYYLIDCPLPRNCKDWYDLGIRKSCYYSIYPDRKTQKLVSTVYNSTNKL